MSDIETHGDLDAILAMAARIEDGKRYCQQLLDDQRVVGLAREIAQSVYLALDGDAR